MTSKKKGKKNSKGKSKCDDLDKVAKYNPYVFFNSEEISQIKAVLKIKEVLNIPIAIGCVILNKLDVLETVVKKGLDINEVGPNNTTALIWAIRYKYLDLVSFLLEHGADPRARIDNGENTVIIALEHKLWDETTFLIFWEKLEKFSRIDVNCTNKNGHTILHIAVRREWERFIDKLFSKNLNIDITNINGVTPLMTACFRNNFNIVNVLINKGADFKKEDNHYRTALCYAIVTGSKISKIPFQIAERIVFELRKDLSFKEYIKRRIHIISIIMTKEKISDAEFEMLIAVTQYIVQRTENGLKMLLDLKMLDVINKAIMKTENQEKQKLLFLIIQELLCYNEQVVGFSTDTQLKLSNQFLNSSLTHICLGKIKSKEVHHNLAFIAFLLFCTSNEIGHKWLTEKYNEIKDILRVYSSELLLEGFQKDLLDEGRKKLIKKKMKKLRRYINNLEDKPNESSEDCKNVAEKKSESTFSLKKSKRRSKIMKAKIAKIKNMELTERLSIKFNSELNKSKEEKKEQDNNEPVPEPQPSTSNVNIFSAEKEETIENEPNMELFKFGIMKPFQLITASTVTDPSILAQYSCKSSSLLESQMAKKIQENEQMIKTYMTDDIFCPYYEEQIEKNPITSSLKQFLKIQEDAYNKEEPSIVQTFPEWKSKIHRLPFNDWSSFSETMKINKKELKYAIQYIKKISNNQDNTCNAFNLDAALNIVIEYLKELLEIIILRSKHKKIHLIDIRENKNAKATSMLEKQMIAELQANVHYLISSICSLAHTNLPEALKNIYHLESTLLKFPVRGKSLLPDVCALEQVKIQYTTFSYDAETSYLSYIENVLNEFEDLRDDIKITVLDGCPYALENEPPGLYEKEMSMLSPAKPRNKRKELEGKLKTMEHAYHLVDSIERLIADDGQASKGVFLKADLPNSDKYCEPTEKYSDMVLKMLTKHVGGEKSENSRWSDKIQYLQNTKHSQVLLGGDVRVGKFPERNHIISQGGNFNLVTLGMSSDNQPLAVKRIPKEHSVCKILKALINPLLGLRHKHILHYFVCDYDEKDFILATPLCEYNIGQYVLLLKENADKRLFNLNHIDIIRQFLNGLSFLHQRPEPIVHGNLKPSNIFVDINGTVRLAEFGVSKALFKMMEAPQSSLVWVSQETYKMYKHASAIECSIGSDIQVAGMLLYFIISGGIHPFGPDVGTILKNFEKVTLAVPSTRNSKNQIFADLVSWMLMYEPNDRPNIKQVLSHVLFWSVERKWRFILNCAGISNNGVPLSINVVKVHEAIDKMTNQEQIRGHWVNIIRRKFPKIIFQCEDTVVGLLKFVGQFYENQKITEENINELKSCILSYFPAFPLTLYRILEATTIIKEYPFVAYTMAETLVS